MALGDFFRLSALLARVARYEPDGGRADGRVVELLDQQTPHGVVYDLYSPGTGAPRTTVVAVHGVASRGRRDPRLRHFGRSLARSRVACVAPTLEGLASHSWVTADLDALTSTIDAAAGIAPVPLGLIGFSFGGSYALLSAARPQVAGRVRFAITVGAYHSLNRVFEWYAENQHRVPSTEAEWDDAIYLRLILASQHRDRLGLDGELRARVDGLLQRYCFEAGPQEKRRFYEEHLRHWDLFTLGAAHRDRELLEALSPAGRLAGLRCRVSLIHDERDSIVPPSEARALLDELRSAGDPTGDRHALLVTSLLSHVNLQNIFRLGEVRRLYRALEPVLG